MQSDDTSLPQLRMGVGDQRPTRTKRVLPWLRGGLACMRQLRELRPALGASVPGPARRSGGQQAGGKFLRILRLFKTAVRSKNGDQFTRSRRARAIEKIIWRLKRASRICCRSGEADRFFQSFVVRADSRCESFAHRKKKWRGQQTIETRLTHLLPLGRS